ncbi:ATP-binding protein [Algimonas porphyrae]|uniref:histidine kinase n=1 Tax=Algimonas porphyrae TaxID=1128113 RepID=A0ABQ5V1Z5_9PROT|nr:ATP-binding protein [Algimonas porphyrae]GLQ20714.1 hypothetical protein GCM10007854_16690 [Algimonas porphyrae]
MSLQAPRLLVSVKQKLFAGFLAMTVLIASLGGYALLSINDAGQVVTDTFDRPLMAINFARSASQAFAALELEVFRPSDPDNPFAAFDTLSVRFTEDLAVARERSIAPRADDFFEDVAQDFRIWENRVRGQTAAGRIDQDLESLALTIETNLDIIVELQTNESFRNREAALSAMALVRRYTGYALSAALFLTVGLSIWLALTIVRPLKAAARVAEQISAGRLNTLIPKGGDDETGQLLRTMRDMQSNIRERMEMEQDLRTLAQHRLADSLENSKDAILLTDVDGCIILANPGVMSLFDAQLTGDIVGSPCESHFGIDGVPRTIGSAGLQEGNNFQLPDGRWVRVNASTTREGGRLFIWSDITESRDRSERLRIALTDAQAASRAKTMFLAAMGHELNTPLNAIVGLSDVLQREFSKDDGHASYAGMVGLISESGGKIAQIVRDMLEIANGETDPVDLGKLPSTDLRSAVDAGMKDLTALAAERSVKLIWNRPDHACEVKGEMDDLSQLVFKLLDNGVKFNRPGGAVKAQINVRPDGRLRLDVIDTGIGIKPDDFDRICQPFIQLDAGYSRAVDGTGLGLSIVDRIARRLGGNLSVRSVPGKGSVFTVTLPQSTQSPRTTSRKEAA